MKNDSLKINQNDDGTYTFEWDKKDPNWEFLNKLTSEQIEGIIQDIVKEDLNGQ